MHIYNRHKHLLTTSLSPSFCVLEEFVEELNGGQVGVNVDALVYGVVIEEMFHGRRRESVDVR